MLPMIENDDFHQQLEDTPYRLPSRLQGDYRDSTFSRSFTGISSKRNYLCSRRANTRLSMNLLLPDEQIIKLQDNMATHSQMELTANTQNLSNCEFGHSSSRKYNKYSSFSRQTPNINQKVQFSGTRQITENLIWISELKIWLSENITDYDFFKLAKTATLHESELWKNLHIAQQKITKKNQSIKKQIDLFQIGNSNKNTQIAIARKENISNKLNSLKPKQFYENQKIIIETKFPINQQLIEPINEVYKTNASDPNESTNQKSSKISINSEIKIDTKNFISKESIPNPIVTISNQESITKTDFQTPYNEVQESFLETKNSPKLDDEFSNEQTNSVYEIHMPITSQTNSNSTDLKTTKNVIQRDRRQKRHRQNAQNIIREIVDEVKEVQCLSDFESNDSEIEEETVEILTDEIKSESEFLSLPIIQDIDQSSIKSVHENENSILIRNKLAPLLKIQKQRWGVKKRDLRFMNELEIEKRSEERKFKIGKLIEKARQRKRIDIQSINSDGPRFETYGFLAKYCILKKMNVSLYRNTFDACDEGNKLWLNENELMMALKGVNPNLKDYDVEYLNLVMKTCDYNLESGADFKLFAILAALSIQITTLDSWIKNKLGMADFKTLEKKIFFGRKLWEVNVDPNTNTIPLSILTVELKAGGVKQVNIDEINQRLGWMKDFNILDFLTYIPLFILLHTSIIENPLDVSEKL